MAIKSGIYRQALLSADSFCNAALLGLPLCCKDFHATDDKDASHVYITWPGLHTPYRAAHLPYSQRARYTAPLSQSMR